MTDGIATLIACCRELAEHETLLAARHRTSEGRPFFERTTTALQSVAYPVGSSHKRFARSLAGREAASLSRRQQEHVARLAWRYRRQIAPRLVPPSNPDA